VGRWCGLCVAKAAAIVHECGVISGISSRPFAASAPLAVVFCAVTVAACSDPGRTGSAYLSSTPRGSAIRSSQAEANARCKPYAGVFDELVACQRSNGSLDSFADRTIAWRVRYFVRHSEMPCDEAPTVEEAYVFNLVVNDLNTDQNLNAEQRIAIRDAMFAGKSLCKT
jgi:hypothetical protein